MFYIPILRTSLIIDCKEIRQLSLPTPRPFGDTLVTHDAPALGSAPNDRSGLAQTPPPDTVKKPDTRLD